MKDGRWIKGGEQNGQSEIKCLDKPTSVLQTQVSLKLVISFIPQSTMHVI